LAVLGSLNTTEQAQSVDDALRNVLPLARRSTTLRHVRPRISIPPCDRARRLEHSVTG
jgi:hypothetical protein